MNITLLIPNTVNKNVKSLIIFKNSKHYSSYEP